MTITDRNEAAPTAAKNEMSPQTRTAIGVVALVACLLVGGGIVYWLLFASSPRGKKSIQVDPQAQAAAPRGVINVQRQRRDAPGITKTDDAWVILSTTGEMRLRDKAASAADSTYRFPGGLKLPPEQVSLLAGRFR